jgi:hypothetical protein
MFGYITANKDKLTDEENQYYRACYCGLCNTLGNRHGSISRITITYDLTFLVLFLTASYEIENAHGTERCIAHPLTAHNYWVNEITDYAADMSIVLSYFKFLDDWNDDRKLLALSEAKMFEQKYQQIAEQYPQKCQVIRKALNELAVIEASGELNADIPANCFGELMGEVFAIRHDDYEERLRAFGISLGKFIYIMDACMDLEKDIKKERYNPMVTASWESFDGILNVLMADCVDNYQQLQINNNKDLIENILYSGVWMKYAVEKKIKEKHRK